MREGLDELCLRRDALRESWRAVRLERLARRDELIASGKSASAVRADGIYRKLKKTQKGYTVQLKHVEGRISRERARGSR